MKKYPSAPVPETQVGYLVGRTMIKSGDLISFFESHEESFAHQFTTKPILFFTGSRIYHTGIAVWMTPEGETEPRLMLVEGVGVGRRLVNLSKFKDRKMEVHSVPPGVDRRAIVNYMLDGIGLGYNFLQLPALALAEFFGFKQPRTKEKQVCSESAAVAWQHGGFKFEDGTALSPGRLRNYLGSRGVPPTFMINPDAGS